MVVGARTVQSATTDQTTSIYAQHILIKTMKLVPYIFIAIAIFSEVSTIATTPII